MTFKEIASEARYLANRIAAGQPLMQRVESEADPDIKKAFELIAELADRIKKRGLD